MQNFTSRFNLKRLALVLCLQLLFITAFAQVPVVAGGIGQTNADPNNAANGGAATGLGCGGGGANYYGGNGGDGMYGGGGGGASGFSALNMVGGAGGQGVLVVAFYNGVSFLHTTVYQNGTSLTITPLITSVKVWAIGAGGGGAGSTDNDGTVGGGGGAGGVAYITKAVTTGDIITYSLGAGGTGGIDANNGSNGGNTTATVTGSTITGNGGSGGEYNNNTDAPGGSYSGGDGGSNGGDGKGSNGDIGGCGGGAIGGAIGGTPGSGDGASGANSIDISGLFAALNGGTILPVKWGNFTLSNQNNSVMLQWQTSYELNTLNFTVQYSTDGINFKDIAVVPASGNSSNGKTYNYTHVDPLPVTGYYRVFQTDINGKTNFSGIIKNTWQSSKEKDFVLTANTIVNGSIKIQLNKTAVITLLSVDGKMVYSSNMEVGINYINVSILSKGYYFLRSADQSQKIIIQ
jgi:hypothetical protein